MTGGWRIQATADKGMPVYLIQLKRSRKIPGSRDVVAGLAPSLCQAEVQIVCNLNMTL